MNYAKLLESATRWYVCLHLLIYGLGKMSGEQFYRHGHLPERIAHQTVEQLSPFDLAWIFFGYSAFFIFFVGILQVLGGLMLLWERTKLLGVALLLPILLNIIVIDAAFEVPGAIISAILYFSMLLFIMWYNREKIALAFAALTTTPTIKHPLRKDAFVRLAIITFIIVAIFFLETLLLKFDGFNRF